MKKDDGMSIRSGDGGEDSDEGEGEAFLYEEEIVHEYDIDEQADNDQVQEETFDSVYLFGGHTGNYDEEHCICTLACSPVDPCLVATGGEDDKAFLWKIGNPCAVIELQGHEDTVASVTFSHDGQLLASGCYDGLVRIWDAALGTLKFALEGSGKGFEWTKWHPKGHLIIAGSEDSGVYMWNADRGHFLGCFSGHSDGVSCGGFTPDGKVVCSGSLDRTMRIWNPKTGECIHRVSGHNYHQSSLSCMEITADSIIAITGALDGSVHMVNLSSGQVMSSLEGHEDSVECIGVSPSFGFAATGGMDNKLIIWELQRSSPRCICEHQEGVTCVAWLGTTQYVASGCMDGKVRIWDSLSGNCERTFTGHGRIHALALTADGTSIVSVSFDGKSDVFRI